MRWLRNNPVTSRVRRFGRLGWKAWEQFARDNCMLLAAALSFYGILSLIPLSFFALWTLSHWFGPEHGYQMVSQFIRQNIPQSADVIIEQVDAIRQSSADWMTGSLWGILPLAWAGSQFYETLERITTSAWAGRPLRGYFHRKLVTLITFLCAGLFFAASLLLTTALATLQRLDSKALAIITRDFPWLWRLTSIALPYLLSVILFFLLYKFLPNAKVPSALALKTAAAAGVLWELSKSLFASFIAREQMYQHLYGSLTNVVAFMLWIYFSAVILLLGAELAAAYHFDDG